MSRFDLDLADKVVRRLYDNRKADYLRPAIVDHLRFVGAGAGMVAREIAVNHPELADSLDSDLIAMAGALHDVGRFLHESQAFHEIRSYGWVLGSAIGEGLVNNIDEATKVASTLLPHSVVHEQFNMLENTWARQEFQHIDSDMLIPQSLAQYIVAYTDLSVGKTGDVGDYRTRIEELVAKSVDPIYAPSNPTLAQGLQLGMPRILEMCEEVHRLRGKS